MPEVVERDSARPPDHEGLQGPHRAVCPLIIAPAACFDLQRVKNTLTYVLHGKEAFVDRMGAAIFDPTFKLAMVGRSVVQELLGWVNQEDIPICNGRTVKSLRFLGYGLSA